MKKQTKKTTHFPPLLFRICLVLLFCLITYLTVLLTYYRIAQHVKSADSATAQKIAASSDKTIEAAMIRACIPDEKHMYAAEYDNGSFSPAPAEIQFPQSEQITAADENSEQPAMEVLDVVGDYYRGKMMVVKDPSRVFVGVSGPLGAAYAGKRIPAIIESYGAIGGVNAGGFYDPNGTGNGGTPNGLVISEGKLRYGSLSYRYQIAGFDKDNVLHCGTMTGQEALNLGIRDCACFGPTLISNGKRGTWKENLGNYNPRTAIGQRADGTVLILALEGRQMSSLGTNISTLADIMENYGAVNASNMDGGASTVMYYQGQQIINFSSLNNSRAVPTAWLVRPE